MNIRDSYCTPRKVTRRLPMVDFDPASNPRSTVKAKAEAMLERGENGLRVSWEGLTIGCNPPWSAIGPFARKIWESEAFWLIVPEDTSTKWWRHATQFPCFRFSFYGRIDFDGPPGIEVSSNEYPTCLIADPKMRAMIGDSLKGLGMWWGRE